MSHSWSSCNYIIPVATFSIIYNIPKFFELTTEVRTFTRYNNLTNISNLTGVEDMQVEMILVVATSLRQNTIYVQVYLIYMNLVFNGLISSVKKHVLG